MKQAKVLTDKELKKVIDYIDAFDRHADTKQSNSTSYTLL